MIQIKHDGWHDWDSYYTWEQDDAEKQRQDIEELRKKMYAKRPGMALNVREVLARHWTTILAGSLVGALLLWAFGFIRGIRL